MSVSEIDTPMSVKLIPLCHLNSHPLFDSDKKMLRKNLKILRKISKKLRKKLKKQRKKMNVFLMFKFSNKQHRPPFIFFE